MVCESAGLLYSPLPPEAYSRKCEKDGSTGIGYQMRNPEQRALWNLYWLSEPRLDEFLNGGPFSRLDFKMYTACKKALEQQSGGRLLADLVQSLAPPVFAEHIASNEHKDLEPFKLGGVAWLKGIRARAEVFRGIVSAQGNAYFVRFTPKLGVTAPAESAKIMTLAFTKS